MLRKIRDIVDIIVGLAVITILVYIVWAMLTGALIK